VSGVPDVFAIAPDAAAAGFGASPPAGTAGYVTAVRPQADAWGGVHMPATDQDPGVDGAAGRPTRGEVAATAAARAQALGLSAGGRALTTRGWDGAQDWVDTLLAPIAVGGSVVIVRNAPDEPLVERRMAQERATVRI